MEACDRVTGETDIYNIKKIRDGVRNLKLKGLWETGRERDMLLLQRDRSFPRPPKEKKRFIWKYGEGRLEPMEQIHTRRRKDNWGEEAYWGERRRRRVLVQLCLVRPTGMNCLQGAWPWLRDTDTPPFNPWHTHICTNIPHICCLVSSLLL